MKHLLSDLYDSGVILIFIFLYIITWAVFMGFIFRNSVEGYFYFKDISSSFYSMMILLTTANFPDVMLPAYKVNFFNELDLWQNCSLRCLSAGFSEFKSMTAKVATLGKMNDFDSSSVPVMGNQ